MGGLKDGAARQDYKYTVFWTVLVPACVLFAEFCWPGVARHATHFFCFAKKSKQKKATLAPASPTLRSGATCGARSSRGQKQLASLRQVFALIRLDLRSSAHPQGASGSGDKY